MAPTTFDLPKALVKVGGIPIIFRQIDNLLANNISDITVVTGHKGEVLTKAIGEHYPTVKTIFNAEYLTTNSMYSALLAKDYFYRRPFVLMNGDVFFEAASLDALLSLMAENAMVTEEGRYLEDAMKVTVADGCITQISKNITQDKAFGVACEIYKFSGEAGAAFFDKCEEYINRSFLQMWSEVALNDILPTVKFHPCPTAGKWMEIDTRDDWREAWEMFAPSAVNG